MARVGLSWTVEISRKGIGAWIRYPKLPSVYRAATQFASSMQAAGPVSVNYIVCDELAVTASLQTSHDAVDILYVSGHGEINAAGHYDLCLYDADWSICASGLGGTQLAVAIFDTCNLIDSAAGIDESHWNVTSLGRSVRLLLGFDGPAHMGGASTDRGAEFARRLLAGASFTDAWIQAVQLTTLAPYNNAVALGVGDTALDAKAVLNATWNSIPTARVGSSTVIVKA